jgi:hypothetical protein
MRAFTEPILSAEWEEIKSVRFIPINRNIATPENIPIPIITQDGLSF